MNAAGSLLVTQVGCVPDMTAAVTDPTLIFTSILKAPHWELLPVPSDSKVNAPQAFKASIVTELSQGS